MFKFPSDFEKTDFVGTYLAEICLGVGTVALKFGKTSRSACDAITSLALHGKYSCIVSGVEHSCRASEPMSAIVLTVFLNSDVTDLSFDDRFAVKICFGETGAIYVYQDASEFESFAISIPGKLEIVGP